MHTKAKQLAETNTHKLSMSSVYKWAQDYVITHTHKQISHNVGGGQAELKKNKAGCIITPAEVQV